MDTSKDGEVSFEEFKQWWNRDLKSETAKGLRLKLGFSKPDPGLPF